MLDHPLAHLGRVRVRLGYWSVPDAHYHTLASVELALNQPLVTDVQGLPATGEQHTLGLLEEVGQLVDQLIHTLALPSTRVE